VVKDAGAVALDASTLGAIRGVGCERLSGSLASGCQITVYPVARTELADELSALNFHDLRRTNASVMVAEGVDVKTAQARLGHSDPRLTLAIYAQATTEGDRSAAKKLGARLMGSSKGDAAASSPPSS